MTITLPVLQIAGNPNQFILVNADGMPILTNGTTYQIGTSEQFDDRVNAPIPAGFNNLVIVDAAGNVSTRSFNGLTNDAGTGFWDFADNNTTIGVPDNSPAASTFAQATGVSAIPAVSPITTPDVITTPDTNAPVQTQTGPSQAQIDQARTAIQQFWQTHDNITAGETSRTMQSNSRGRVALSEAVMEYAGNLGVRDTSYDSRLESDAENLIQKLAAIGIGEGSPQFHALLNANSLNNAVFPTAAGVPPVNNNVVPPVNNVVPPVTQPEQPTQQTVTPVTGTVLPAAHTVYKDTTAAEMRGQIPGTYFVEGNYENGAVEAALVLAGLGTMETIPGAASVTEYRDEFYKGYWVGDDTFVATQQIDPSTNALTPINPPRIVPSFDVPAGTDPLGAVYNGSFADASVEEVEVTIETRTTDTRFVLKPGVTNEQIRDAIRTATVPLVQAVENGTGVNLGFNMNITEVNLDHSGLVGVDPSTMFIQTQTGEALRNPWPVEVDSGDLRGYYLRTWDADVARMLVDNMAPRAQTYGELTLATTVPSQQLSTDIVGQNQNGEVTYLQSKGYITQSAFDNYLASLPDGAEKTHLTGLGYTGVINSFNNTFNNDPVAGEYLRGFLDAVVPHPLAAYRSEMAPFLEATYGTDPVDFQAAVDRYNASGVGPQLNFTGAEVRAFLLDENTLISQGNALDEFLTFAHTEHVAMLTANLIHLSSHASTTVADGQVIQGNPDLKLSIVSDILVALPANSPARNELLASLPQGTVIQVENLYNVDASGVVTRDDALYAQIQALQNDPMLVSKGVSFQVIEYFDTSVSQTLINAVGDRALADGLVPVFDNADNDIVAGSVGGGQDALSEMDQDIVDARTNNFYFDPTNGTSRRTRAAEIQPDWLDSAQKSSNVVTAAIENVVETALGSNDNDNTLDTAVAFARNVWEQVGVTASNGGSNAGLGDGILPARVTSI